MMLKPLTGRKVLFIALAFFGVIVAVNLTMAFSALGTFPGVVVEDSYVANLDFNELRQAQQALGWRVSTRQRNGRLLILITGRDGQPARVASLSARIGRPAEARDDVRLQLAPAAGGFEAPLALAPGRWQLRLSAKAEDGTRFHQDLILRVAG